MPREATIVEVEQEPRDRVLALRREIPPYIFYLPMVAGFGFHFYIICEMLSVGPDSQLLLYIAYCYLFSFVYSCLVSPFIKNYHDLLRLKYLRQKILARPDALFDAYNPEAILIYRISIGNRAVKPYERWIDIGLLLIDHEIGEIKYEGDLERWIVPRDAITSAKLDTYGSVLYKGTLMLWLQLPNQEKRLRPIKPIRFGVISKHDLQAGYFAEILHRAIGHFVDPERYSRPSDDELRPLVPPRR
jgi:hypothetical protein